MAYKDILFEVEGGIATITFNRPEVLNALKMGTLTEVGEAIETILSLPSILPLRGRRFSLAWKVSAFP